MNIKALREGLGLTQEALAKRLEVSILTIHNWESGVHQPKGQRLARLIDLMQQAQTRHRLLQQAEATRRSGPLPATDQATEAAPIATTASSPDPTLRPVISLGEAVRRMGLKDEGHGRRSDHTIRKAIKRGVLPAWKAPGYRAAIAEWRMFVDDFDRWRATRYQAQRDPRQ